MGRLDMVHGKLRRVQAKMVALGSMKMELKAGETADESAAREIVSVGEFC